MSEVMGMGIVPAEVFEAEHAEVERLKAENERLRAALTLQQDENTQLARYDEAFHRAEDTIADLQQRLEAAERERDRYKAALERIRDEMGHVCEGLNFALTSPVATAAVRCW